jgi:ferrous-iron efflux pump FieF
MLGSLADTGLDVLASLITSTGCGSRPSRPTSTTASATARPKPLPRSPRSGSSPFRRSPSAGAPSTDWPATSRPPTPNMGSQSRSSHIALTLALLAYQRRIIARTGSVAIGADHVHYQSDLLLNLAVIAALVLDQFSA